MKKEPGFCYCLLYNVYCGEIINKSLNSLGPSFLMCKNKKVELLVLI